MTTKAEVLASLLAERYQPVPKTPAHSGALGPTRQWALAKAVDEYVDSEPLPVERLGDMRIARGTQGCGQLFPSLTVPPNVEVTTTEVA